MLKPVLYYLLLLTTAVRFADIIYLLSKETTNLPIVVVVVTSVMVLYGIALGVKKFISTVRLKQLVTFYMVQTGMILFNLVYVAVTCPLHISVAETLIVGTFLDVLVNIGLIYLSMKQIRSFHIPVVQNVSVKERRMNV